LEVNNPVIDQGWKGRFFSSLVEVNNPVIDQAWKGRFFSNRGTSAFRRGVISLLTIALEFLALLLFCDKRGTPLSRRTAALPRQGFLIGRRYRLRNAAWRVKRASKSLCVGSLPPLFVALASIPVAAPPAPRCSVVVR